jgi:flagellar hook-basal body complex protein FliE
MAIDPIGPIGSITSVTGPLATDAIGASATSGADFAATLSRGVENLQTVQNKADDLAVQAATGTLADVHDYMIAATEASLTTQLTTALRNKALEAFNEIMRLQA